MDLHQIARAVAPQPPRLRLRQGEVTAVDASGLLTVRIAGAETEVPAVRALASVCPMVGGGVWLATDGLDLFAVGTMTPTGPATASVVRTAAGTVANNSFVTISLGATATVERDTHGMFDAGAPDRLTAQVPGVYLLTAQVAFAGHATGYRSLSVDVNTAVVAVQRSPTPGAGVNAFLAASASAELAAGDYVQMTLRQTSGAALALTVNDYAPRLQAVWLRPVTP